MSSTYYQVFITPLIRQYEYDDEIEVTNYVSDDGVGKIRRGIDSTDYGIGAFFFDDIQLKCQNINGILNDEADVRSIFKYSRDQAKVRVVYTDTEGEETTFRGLINEEATKLDITKDEITFRVLSRDSVIRNAQVPAGSITNASLVSSAFMSMLNQPEITAVLNVDEDNINPSLDYTIDVGSELENQSVREALNKLLVTSNSVLLVDENDNVIIRNRHHNEDGDILILFGAYDLKRRQNIISLSNYNPGKHRMFTAVKVNDTEQTSSGYQQQFGYRQKAIDAPWVTDLTTIADIANEILEEFKSPKIELEVVVPTYVARDVQIFDLVSIENPLRLKPYDNSFFPVIGQAVIGDDDTPLPYIFGSVSIPSQLGFKVIEIKEEVKNFQTTLKLRQIGTEFGDGSITSGTCAIIGFGIVGTGTICLEGDEADTFNPSIIGAAVVGLTEVA